MATKRLKKLDFYVYFFQEWVHTEKALTKLSICLFLIKDEELFQKYNEILERITSIIKKKNDTELVYNENNLKAKIKCYIGKINTHLHNNKTPKDGSQFIF